MEENEGPTPAQMEQLDSVMRPVIDRIEEKVKTFLGEGQSALQDVLEAVQRHTTPANEGAVSYGLEGDKSLERIIRSVEMQLIDPKDGGVQKNGKDMLEQCERTVQMVATLKFGPRAVVDKSLLKSLFK